MNERLDGCVRRRAGCANAAVLVCAGALGGLCGSTAAQDPAPVQRSTAAASPAGAPSMLERSFWACDYAATVALLDSGTAGACSAIVEDFRKTRFNGDFDAMLAWWRQHKDAAHRTLGEGRRARSGAGAERLTAR
jgi:hypothetical protein